MSGPQVKWELVGDATKSHQAISSVDTKAQSLTSRLQGVGKGMVIGAGIGAFNLLTGALDMAIGKLGEMDQAFKDDQASQVLLSTALQNNIPNWDGNTASVEAYAAAQAALGFQDDAVRASIGQLVGVTHDLTTAQELNTLAEDLARAKHIDLAQATDIVGKAFVGNGKALKGLGIDIAGATTGAELLDAVQKNVKGSAEAWAATSEGKTAKSQVKVSEAMEKIGGVIDKVAQVALPILADAFAAIADVVAAVFPYVQRVVQALLPVFRTVFGIIGGLIGGIIALFKGIGTVVGTVFGSVGTIIKGAINFVIRIINGVIGSINSIQVHIHVGPVNLDWNGLRIPKLPTLHLGGVVPGQPGAEVLTVLQAGERVIPAGAPAGMVPAVVNIYINDAGYVDGPALDRFARAIAQRLNLVGVT